MFYFSEIPLMVNLSILCSDPNILNEVSLKKIEKENIRKFFVTHKELSKIFHVPSLHA